MAHRFRTVSFVNTGFENDEPSEESMEKGTPTPQGQAIKEKPKLARRHTEQMPVISDEDYIQMSNIQTKPRSRTKISVFSNDDLGELHASKVLPVLTLTSNSKFVGYVDETRKRASTKRVRKATVLEEAIFETIEEEPEKPDRGSSLILTIWNLLPLLQGSSVFSMPYTVRAGGYCVLILLPLISLMATITGTILVECMYEIPPGSKTKKRVRKDYVAVARSVWGIHGARIMNVILLFYLFTGDVVNIVLLGKCVYELLSPVTDLSFVVLTAIFSVLCYPTLFIKRLTVLAYLSFLSIFSVVIGIITILIVFFTESVKWSHHIKDLNFINVKGVPLAAGIFMFSCLTHSVLPRVESDMAAPRKLNKAVYISYSVSTVTKTVVAFLGAITFGNSTESIVSLNVGEINTIAKYVCAIALSGFAIFNFPLEMFVVCENVDTLINNTKYSKEYRYYYPWLIVTRFLLVALTVAIALVVPYFGIVLAIRGSLIGTCLIFIFPCYFHLKLKWRELTKLQKVRDIGIMTLGTIIGVLALYSSVDSLVDELKG